jgi:hypothetical protein
VLQVPVHGEGMRLLGTVDADGHVDRRAPFLVRAQLEQRSEPAQLRDQLVGARAHAHVAGAAGEQMPEVQHALAGGDRDLAARADAALLDGEQVGEVGAHLHDDRAALQPAAEVADPDVLAHPVADGPVALDEQTRLRLTGTGPQPRDEARAERVTRHDGQRLGGTAVDLQPPPGEHPGIAHEQSLGAGDHVTGATADAERGPLDERDDAAAEHCRLAAEVPSRLIRAADGVTVRHARILPAHGAR